LTPCCWALMERRAKKWVPVFRDKRCLIKNLELRAEKWALVFRDKMLIENPEHDVQFSLTASRSRVICLACGRDERKGSSLASRTPLTWPGSSTIFRESDKVQGCRSNDRQFRRALVVAL
jgi:hypothetical protein